MEERIESERVTVCVLCICIQPLADSNMHFVMERFNNDNKRATYNSIFRSFEPAIMKASLAQQSHYIFKIVKIGAYEYAETKQKIKLCHLLQLKIVQTHKICIFVGKYNILAMTFHKYYYFIY